MSKKSVFFIVLGGLLVFGCSTNKTTSLSKNEYKLVWADEFNYTGKPDSKKWGFEYGLIRNREKQYYTDDLKNARVENGNLIIEARKEQVINKKYVGKDSKAWMKRDSLSGYTSASLTTVGIAEWTYGKIEVSAKLAEGVGLWPAIWMLGSNYKEVGWPKCGEIDIMEHVGFMKDSIFGSVHTEAYNHMKGNHKKVTIFIDKPYAEFHAYAVEWTPEKVDFLLDGKVYNHFENEHKTEDEWPFDDPQYLKINIAIGGMLGGKKGINDDVFPEQMLIDYVRVYQMR